jgi:hypothetical protein
VQTTEMTPSRVVRRRRRTGGAGAQDGGPTQPAPQPVPDPVPQPPGTEAPPPDPEPPKARTLFHREVAT